MSLDFDLYRKKYTTYDKVNFQEEKEEVFSANITHNLAAMADEAGLYECLWNPVENGYTKAGQLIDPINNGLKRLKKEPGFYKKFDSPNGWGTYDNLLGFAEECLVACMENPDAFIFTYK